MPSPAATAILQFGRTIHAEAQRPAAERDPQHVETAEARLIEQLATDDNPLLKPALMFHVSKPLDPLVLRVLSLVAFIELGTNCCATVSDVANAVADHEPSKLLEARQTITRLLYAKRLSLQPDTVLELGQPMLALLTGGGSAMPLAVTPRELQAHWQRAAAAAAKRQAQADPQSLPTARQLEALISQTVIGLQEQVRTVACRFALHLRRSALIRGGNDPGSPNECLLLIGPSGCGKTFLAECAGRVSGLPFGSVSATDMSAQAYIGLSVEDSIKPLITAAGGDAERARFGVALVDEIDKKAAAPTSWRDVGGSCVQQEFLRLMEGTTFQVGGRRGGFDDIPVQFNSRGTLFLFAGAYSGIERLMDKRSNGIGFGGEAAGRRRQAALYEALEQYGMLAEWLNRLTAVLVFPEPTVAQLVDIANRSVIPSFNRLLVTCLCGIEPEPSAIRLLAQVARDSRTYARGLKSVIAKVVEDAIYDEKVGTLRISPTEIRRAIAAAGLG